MPAGRGNISRSRCISRPTGELEHKRLLRKTVPTCQVRLQNQMRDNPDPNYFSTYIDNE